MTHNSKFGAVLALALFFLVAPAHAVLKERNLQHTLGILKLELQHKYEKQKELMERNKESSVAQHQRLVDYMQKSEQISLILYSQNSEFTFDVAYACQQATDLYHELSTHVMPFDKIKEKISGEIARYDSLITALKALAPSITDDAKEITAEDSILINLMTDSLVEEVLTPAEAEKEKERADLFVLSEEDQKDRNDCLTYAQALRDLLAEFLTSLEDDSFHYSVVTHKVEMLNAYAQERYKDLQKSLFANSGSNYFATIMNFPRHWMRAKNDLTEKYLPFSNKEPQYPDDSIAKDKKHSEWRGAIVPFVSVFMLVYIFIATILSNVILRFIPALICKIAPKFGHRTKLIRHGLINDEDYKKKRPTLILALGILLFTITITIVGDSTHLNIMHMATTLMTIFAWLVEAILISLLIRLNASQIRQGVNIYMPFLWMALIVVFFRIILVPNTLINLVCPPLLLGLTIWQLVLFVRKKALPLADSVLAGISLTVMIVSCIFAWMGSTLLAVQIIIWWTFQLTCIETVILFYDILSVPVKRQIKKKELINKTWPYDLCRKALLPIAVVVSIPLSVYWAAGIFEMTDAFLSIFTKEIVISETVGAFSIMKLCIAIALFFLFKFISFLLSAIYHLIRVKHLEANGGSSNETLIRNLVAILVWGLYIIGILAMFKVPWAGITIVFTGLATGMGFAMKDLLENFFYGISLMSGRVRVGDYIECDGIRGKVDSITYQSTQIITSDGSVMAFLNSALFSKNFKNLTRNHRYEFTSIPVGIAYGSNIADVRRYLIEAVKSLSTKTDDGRDIFDEHKDIEVRVNNFGDNSVDLSVIAWTLVDQRGPLVARIKEVVYDTLNAHNVEIPFPQRDIFIKNFEKNS